MNADTCFHCALPVGAEARFEVELGGVRRPVCCPGCKAVAELIRDGGMSRYYAMREMPRPGDIRPRPEVAEWSVFDRGDMQDAFTESSGGSAEASVFVGGMYCSACSWLVESRLCAAAGVLDAAVNPVTHRLHVRFDPAKTGLGGILATLSALGYRPQPMKPQSADRPELAEQRSALKRLLVASLGMMQVMMFAVALYAGEFQGIDLDMQRFFRLVSFAVTTPVVFYSARPFFSGALRGLRARQPGMDLPVAIAIGGAYAASVYSTFTDGADVWYDSVTMFVFFLTVGRYLEMRARHRSIDRSAALTSLLPATVTRVNGDQREVVAASGLLAGDRILLRAGDAVPADGIILSGHTSADESLLTGESNAQPKSPGDPLVAGSVNLGGSVEMRVERTGADSTPGVLSRLAERARYARPAFVQLADRIASHVVVALLLVAAGVALAWSFVDPGRAFTVTLSVLVVTCPCALALATPAAFAAAGARLAQLRLLATRGGAVETLARATHVVFDKTGTLTRGRPAIVSVAVRDERHDEAAVRRIAANLETVSTHPLARAFGDAGGTAPVDATAVTGAGVEGSVDGRHYRLGRRDFAAPGAAGDAPAGLTRVWLGSGGKPVAHFDIDDPLRADARDTVQALADAGYRLALLSGDAAPAVERVAAALSIGNYRAACTPADKLDEIRALQAAGAVVVMVGDGVNDAPVLAGADVSLAPAHAANLAQTSADVILVGESLAPIVTALALSRQTMRIVRQNLAWAVLYNAAALPLAALGFVPPWLAAAGMSASSLIVVLNSLRLSRYRGLEVRSHIAHDHPRNDSSRASGLPARDLESSPSP